MIITNGLCIFTACLFIADALPESIVFVVWWVGAFAIITNFVYFGFFKKDE